MRVKFVGNEALEAKFSRPQFNGYTKGKTYVVITMDCYEGGKVSIRAFDDNSMLSLVNLKGFEIVDGRMSSYWVVCNVKPPKVSVEKMAFLPKSWAEYKRNVMETDASFTKDPDAFLKDYQEGKYWRFFWEDYCDNFSSLEALYEKELASMLMEAEL